MDYSETNESNEKQLISLLSNTKAFLNRSNKLILAKNKTELKSLTIRHVLLRLVRWF